MNNNEIDYWSKFYNNFGLLKQSSFAEFVSLFLKNKVGLKILDVGCGNGRDSYFLSKKHVVTGIDISNKPADGKNCNFILDDMVTISKKDYEIIYSRFTFHSITNEQHQQLLESIVRNTILCIETRSDKDMNTIKVHGNKHYRNLTNIEYLKKLLKDNNFEILFMKESDNFAVYKTENPICIRVICVKK